MDDRSYQYSNVKRVGENKGKFYYNIEFRDRLYAKPDFFPKSNRKYESGFLTAQARDEGNWK